MNRNTEQLRDMCRRNETYGMVFLMGIISLSGIAFMLWHLIAGN